MRSTLHFSLVLALLICLTPGVGFSHDLDNQPARTKGNSHVGINPGTPDGRQGGETIADAVVIPGLPFQDTGNTSDNIDDYDESCPYDGSTSPDVVYSFVPETDMYLSVDLCGSGYDTKTYIWDADLNVVACNDDFYVSGDPCGDYVSYIEQATLMAGVTYYIFVDGYGSDSGEYILNLEETHPVPPCILTCDGLEEGEPALVDEYVDQYNSGCGNDGLPVFQDLVGDENGELVFCGKSGWYVAGGGDFRDTDWFTVVMGPTGLIEWTLDAEQETFGFLLGPANCDAVGVVVDMQAGPCLPATMVIEGQPGDLIWLWAGPSEYVSPVGFVGHEYLYISSLVGLDQGPVATDSISFDGIKSLYR